MESTKSLPDVVKAPRTDAIYNCHSYLTKVPVAAIVPFIEAFTSPGETVIDPFAGSGMTGVAALLANRSASLSDISVLGKHIGDGYLTEVDSESLRKSAEEVVSLAMKGIGTLYQTKRVSDGKTVEIRRAIWSFIYACPECKKEIVYYDEIVMGKSEQCKGCGTSFARRTWQHTRDIPVRVVVCDENGRLVEQCVQEIDLKKISNAEKDCRQKEVPSLEITPDREMYSRSGLKKAGLTQTKSFFSARNGIALLELLRAIEGIGNAKIRKKLLFAFTAILPRASRRYQWSELRPLNAQNQTYYIAPVYFEWSVFDLFLRKVGAVIKSDEEVFSDKKRKSSKVKYGIYSADLLSHLSDESVDYAFTDPPFGSNHFYSDMSLFQEAWLGEVTEHALEAVVHTTGKRKDGAASRYETLMKNALREIFRVLKPGRYCSMVFGNSSGYIWSLIQKSMGEVGFEEPMHLAILDKGQRSVKGLNSGSEGVVTVDLVLTVRKPNGKPRRKVKEMDSADLDRLIPMAIDSLGEINSRNPSYIYVAVVREAIQQGLSLTELHLSDVLISLRNAGLQIDSKTGLLNKPAAKSKQLTKVR